VKIARKRATLNWERGRLVRNERAAFDLVATAPGTDKKRTTADDSTR
jgi:hypothetical protein